MNNPIRQRATKNVPSTLSAETENALRKTDSYRKTWQEYVSQFSEEQLKERQERLIRKHAIETGILERLYDVSWGVTQSLVADGITADVYERNGENANEAANQNALETIKVQLSALQMMVEFVQSSRNFTSGFIKELHSAMTRNQKTIESYDQFGRISDMPMRHGEWKTSANSVERPDGTKWSFVDPLLVQDEIDFLIDEYNKKQSVTHPVVMAAWIHYSFINIHPFADGNGRVARALTLFALLKGQYPPVVVTRELRTDYIAALDQGNDGDLEPLIRFFAKIEENTLLGELNSVPVQDSSNGTVSDLARAFAGRLNKQAEDTLKGKREKASSLATNLQQKIRAYLEVEAQGIAVELNSPTLNFRTWVDSSSPPDEKSRYYSGQIVKAAKAVGFYSNHADGTWWTCLNLALNGKKMKFVAVVQKVGHGEQGVLAVTASAEEYSIIDGGGAEERGFDDLLKVSANDWVNMDTDSKADAVWPEVNEFIERMLVASLAEFFNRAL
jgi:Fic family protein